MHDTAAATTTPRRRQRLQALALDLAVFTVAELAAAVVAIVWLLARTDAGRLDIGDGDAAVALATVSAVVPAWLAWLASHALDRTPSGATPGQRRAGLAVEAAQPRDRLLRLALDPRGLLGMLWLTALLFLGEVVMLRWVALIVTAIAAAMVVASAALWLANPGAAALHDRIARTRLVAR
jgi:hypothetical protein